MTVRYTQYAPRVQQGDSLPDVNSVAENGVFFILSDGTNDELYVLVQHNGSRAWVPAGQGGVVTALPVSGNGSTSDPVTIEDNRIASAKFLTAVQQELGLIDVEIYVNSSTGNDNNPGTSSSPLQTFTKALSLIPSGPRGKCRIYLQGAGPYTLPSFMYGTQPETATGQPLMICGDTMTQVLTGTVQSVSGATLTPTVGGMTVDAYKGMIYHGLTGTSAGKFYQIATNSATQLTSIGGTFSAATNDTFEILTPQTVLTGSTFQITGPGQVGFWRCKFTCGFTDVAELAAVLFDSCVFALTSRFNCRLRARTYMCATSFAYDFLMVKDVGTQVGSVGSFIDSTFSQTFGARWFTGSLFYGYLVTKTALQIQDSSLFFTFGLDADLTGFNNVAVLIDLNTTSVINAGYNRIVGGGVAGSEGIKITRKSAAFITGIDITNATNHGIYITDGSFGSLASVTGSTGNLVGLQVDNTATAENLGSNTLSGSTGTILLDSSTVSISWAQAGTVIASVNFTGVESVDATRAAPATISATSSIIMPVDTNGGAFVQSLPAANSVPRGWRRQFLDVGNFCGTNNFTLQRAGADTIPNGTTSTTKVINTNGGSFWIQSDGTSKWFVS